MNIQLINPIAFFDIESTGVDTQNDKIIELYIKKIMPDNTVFEFYSRFNPEIPSRLEAFNKHGITDEELKSEPLFADKATEIYTFLTGCDLSGYNIINFDIRILAEEFLRCKLFLDTTKIKIIDVFKIYTVFNPRNLESCYFQYTGKKLEGAHAAENDINATIEILTEQISKHELGTSISDIQDKIKYEKDEKYLDLYNKFKLTDKGPVFNFGKHKDRLISEVNSIDPSYIAWIYDKSDLSRLSKIALYNFIKNG